MEKLYEKIKGCCELELIRRNHQLVNNARQLLPDIMEFTNMILKPSNFDCDTETYQALQAQYMSIIQDLMDGMDNQDEVLVMDSLYGGLLEFVNLFLDESE